MSPSFLKAFKSSRHSKNSKKTKETNDTKDTKDTKDAKRPTNIIKKLSSKTSTVPPRTITAFASTHGGKTFVEKSIELPTLGRNDGKISKTCIFGIVKQKRFYILSPIDITRHSLNSF